MSSSIVLAGIFVGGASRRMGGRPKGLLRVADGRTIVKRWRDVFDACGVESVLVGAHPAYTGEPMSTIADAADGAGPLAGLAALLDEGTGARAKAVIAVACDMPYLSAAHVGALLEAPPAVAVAPKRDGRWEPFFARYDAPRASPVVRARLAAGALSLCDLLDALGGEELVLGADAALVLRDWDAPSDVTDVTDVTG